MQTDSEAATENQVLDKRIRGPSEPANEEPAGFYISYYINGYGQPRTSSDLDPTIRPSPGQPAGSVSPRIGR